MGARRARRGSTSSRENLKVAGRKGVVVEVVVVVSEDWEGRCSYMEERAELLAEVSFLRDGSLVSGGGWSFGGGCGVDDDDDVEVSLTGLFEREPLSGVRLPMMERRRLFFFCNGSVIVLALSESLSTSWAGVKENSESIAVDVVTRLSDMGVEEGISVRMMRSRRPGAGLRGVVDRGTMFCRVMRFHRDLCWLHVSCTRERSVSSNRLHSGQLQPILLYTSPTYDSRSEELPSNLARRQHNSRM